MNDVNLWPPFSVTITSMNSQTTGITTTPNNTGNYPTGMLPVYYIPQRTPMPGEYADPNLGPKFPGKAIS